LVILWFRSPGSCISSSARPEGLDCFPDESINNCFGQPQIFPNRVPCLSPPVHLRLDNPRGWTAVEATQSTMCSVENWSDFWFNTVPFEYQLELHVFLLILGSLRISGDRSPNKTVKPRLPIVRSFLRQTLTSHREVERTQTSSKHNNR